MNTDKLETLVGQIGSVGRLINAAQSIIEMAQRRPDAGHDLCGVEEVLAQAALLNDLALDSADALRTGDDAGKTAAERAMQRHSVPEKGSGTEWPRRQWGA